MCSAVVTFAETNVGASCHGPGCDARPKTAARAPGAKSNTHQREERGQSHKLPQPQGPRQGAPPKATRPGPYPPLLGRSDRRTDRDPVPPAGGTRTSATERTGPETEKTAWNHQRRISGEPAAQAAHAPIQQRKAERSARARPKPATVMQPQANRRRAKQQPRKHLRQSRQSSN